MKKMLRYSIITGIAVLLLWGAAFARSLQPVSGDGTPRVFTVSQGEPLRSMSERLANEGLIRSAKSFRVYAVFAGLAHAIKPGTYEVAPSESAAKIIEKFAVGPKDIEVVIHEGATLKDIDRTLAKRGVLPTGAIEALRVADFRAKYPFLQNVKSLEGFLFPDTYRFAPGSSAQTVAEKMLDEFSAKAYSEFVAAGSDWYAALIIASLIEKEAPDVQEDRAIVSGIIARRLNIGMGLQIDATVLYAKCGKALLTCENLRLTRDDYSVASPYNTYLHAGLPPTPIASPGIDAIRAALNPQKTDYLFYLSDPKTKRTIFSRDFEEHNEQRARYLGL